MTLAEGNTFSMSPLRRARTSNSVGPQSLLTMDRKQSECIIHIISPPCFCRCMQPPAVLQIGVCLAAGLRPSARLPFQDGGDAGTHSRKDREKLFGAGV